MSGNTFTAALQPMGYKVPQTAHGLRHLISTALNERGYNCNWIDRQLAHIDDYEIRAVRIPVKPIGHSGGKPVTHSGHADHLSERSDAGIGL